MDRDTLRRMICRLIDRMDDERALRIIYRIVNDLYCRQ